MDRNQNLKVSQKLKKQDNINSALTNRALSNDLFIKFDYVTNKWYIDTVSGCVILIKLYQNERW